jgi:hypothetical protein
MHVREICWNANSIANPGTSTTTTCRSATPAKDLPHSMHKRVRWIHPPTGDEDEEWECPACDLKEHPKPIKIVEVNWRPSWERKAYARTRMSRGWWTHGTKTTNSIRRV